MTSTKIAYNSAISTGAPPSNKDNFSLLLIISSVPVTIKEKLVYSVKNKYNLNKDRP